MDPARECLQTCYNERMTAHFGATGAAKEHVLIDFDQMKHEYQNYQQWHPREAETPKYERGYEES